MEPIVKEYIEHQYDRALLKHPEAWSESMEECLPIIIQELGELAAEVNDGNEYGAMEEAAHVAVTCIRFIEMLAARNRLENLKW